MDFASALDAELKRSNRRAECSVGTVIRSLDDKNRKQFIAAVADPSIANTKIAAALKAATGGSLEIRPGNIGRHRRRECACE